MAAVIVGFLVLIRNKDLPKPAPVSPFRHLDERKAAIYESLRDLQFEYRLNKLSDEDYQASKIELQKELARVLEETDRIKTELGVAREVPAAKKVVELPVKPTCPSCGAVFDKALKFCGECGKPMGVAQ